MKDILTVVYPGCTYPHQPHFHAQRPFTTVSYGNVFGRLEPHALNPVSRTHTRYAAYSDAQQAHALQ